MKKYKEEILQKVGYTELVYGRINKKLGLDLSKDEIEKLVLGVLSEVEERQIEKKGKNFYVFDRDRNLMLTINSFTFRIITATKLDKNQGIFL